MRLSTPHLFYSLLFVFAVGILVLSITRESSHQAEVRLGLASPPPINHTLRTTMPPVPSHGNYPLPYPGILPSHPLYMIKMIRDRVHLSLTTNPEKHTRLLFAYANTRMAAAQALTAEGLIDQALTVATKAETYFFAAVMRSDTIPTDTQTAWFDELKRACLKYEETIETIERMTPPGFGNNQTSNLYRQLENSRQQIIALSHQPFGYLRPEDLIQSASPAAFLKPHP